MSLNHSFELIERDFKEYSDKKLWRKLGWRDLLPLISVRIEIHDDLLFYMYDSLQWITCYNPHKGETHMGLNMHGETIIPPSSSWKAAIVFETWAKLFGLGPEQLHLEGAFVNTVGPPKAGHYEQLVFDRDSTIDALLRLAAQCHQAHALSGKGFILHSGI